MNLEFRYVESIDSTNNELKRQGAEGLKEGVVLSAGMQTAGRGRLGHSWESPKSDSVATSILLRPTVSIENVSRLTILAAMAVSRMTEELYGLERQIKWPNDVLIHEKKICGILTEMILKDNRPDYVIIGIGVNVHQTEFPEDIRDKATSIDLELPSGRASRRAVTESIWTNFMKYYEDFQKTEDLAAVVEEYNAHLVNLGREVRVLDPLGEYSGICEGIDATGALLVRREGEVVRVDSGEVSVRGIYGYV